MKLDATPQGARETSVTTTNQAPVSEGPVLEMKADENGQLKLYANEEGLMAATATSNLALAKQLLEKANGGNRTSPAEFAGKLNATCAAMMAMGPNDHIEAMLAAHILLAFNKSMEYMASNKQSQAEIDRDVNRAAKFTRMFHSGVATRKRHRQNGQQIRVEHINQAVFDMGDQTGGEKRRQLKQKALNN